MSIFTKLKTKLSFNKKSIQKSTITKPSIPKKKSFKSLNSCYFCAKNTGISTYTDGKDEMKVCLLCAEYAHRRAYRKI